MAGVRRAGKGKRRAHKAREPRRLAFKLFVLHLIFDSFSLSVINSFVVKVRVFEVSSCIFSSFLFLTSVDLTTTSIT